MYFLVLLGDPAGQPEGPVDHEAFIDSLIARNAVLLGGALAEPPASAPGVWAAYVLSCGSLDEARAIVATDPLITDAGVTATVTPWELVAVNPAAVSPELVVTPEDIRSE